MKVRHLPSRVFFGFLRRAGRPLLLFSSLMPEQRFSSSYSFSESCGQVVHRDLKIENFMFAGEGVALTS